MCSSMNDRIRINQILSDAIITCADGCMRNLDELTEALFSALQIYYHGLCLDECLETKARSFAARHLSQMRHADRPSRPRLSDAA